MAHFSSRVPLDHVVYLDCLDSPVHLELKETAESAAQSDHVAYLDCLELKEIPDIRESPGITASRECLEFPVRRGIKGREV